MRRPLALIGCLWALSCAEPGEETAPGAATPAPARALVTDSARVEGLRIELVRAGSGCLARHDGAPPREVALALRAPCYFVRRDARPQTFSYPDVGVRSVLVVVGTPVGEEARAKWNLPAGEVCGEEIQGILFREAGPVASSAVQRGGVVCRDAGADEKVFWGFAHDS